MIARHGNSDDPVIMAKAGQALALRLALQLAVLTLLAGATPADDTAHQLALTERVAGVLREKGVEGRIEIRAPLQIRIVPEQGESQTLHLDNLYRGLEGGETEQSEQIEAFLAPILAPAPSDLSPGLLANVLPVVREKAFVDEMRRSAKPDDPILAHKLIDDLWVLYVLDLPDQMRFLTLSGAVELGSSDAGVRARAKQNLHLRLAEVSVRAEGPFYTVHLDDNYESSLLVDDDFWSQIEIQVSGVLVVAVPNRNVLLFTTADDTLAVASLRKTAEKLSTDYSYPITSQLLQRKAGRWSRLE